jgi:hypothetical protein
MIGEKQKVDNQAITEGAKDKMPVTTDFSKLTRMDKERNTVTVNLNLGGSSTPLPPGK